jgi:hypothetical protein
MSTPRFIDPTTGCAIEGKSVIDLSYGEDKKTTRQASTIRSYGVWMVDTGYTTFIRSTPKAASFTMARQLGWPRFCAGRIRAQSRS